MVGEMGREIFIPNQNGKIQSNGSSSGASITINMGNVNIKDQFEMDGFMAELENRIRRASSNASLYAI